METITSADGTTIAYDRIVGGDSGTVILISGAFGYRKFPKMVEQAEKLAADHRLTVINYDRRGRGDSTDTPGVYNVDNEIDDIAALIEAVGGSAALYGWSSGAALALLAAASRVPGITKVVAFEPPFVVDHENHVPVADLHIQLHELIASDRRSETVRFYMTKAMGIPRWLVATMRFTPFWKGLLATANSTAHDWAVMQPYMRGEALRVEDWASVRVPTLVIAGAKSDALLRTGARAIADILPTATHRELAGLSHNPNIAILTPAAGEFLTGTTQDVAGEH